VYQANSETGVTENTADATTMFNIYVPNPVAVLTINIDNVILDTTNRPVCFAESLSLVTDSSGTTLNTDPRFGVTNFNLGIIGTTSYYGNIFLKH